MRRLLPYFALIFITLIWGTTFPLVKAALVGTSPLMFNLLRMVLASAVLLVLNWPLVRSASRRDLRLGALTGVCLALGYQFQTAGLARTTASKSAFITGLVVVLVPLLSVVPRFRAGAKPGAWAFAGAAVAFCGLILLTAEPGAGLLSGFGLGEALSLLCAIAFAAHLLVIARAAGTMPARRLGTLQICFCAITMLVTLPVGGSPRVHSEPILWIALGVTAIFATALAFTVQSWAQGHIPASHAALLFTLEPVFAWLFSLTFLGEHLSPRALAGAGLILLGILVAELIPALGGGTGTTGPENRAILPSAEL